MSVQIGGLGAEEHPQASSRPGEYGGGLEQRVAGARAALIRCDDYILQLAYFSGGPCAEREDERAGADHSASSLREQEQVSRPRRGLRLGEHLGEGAREIISRGEAHAVVCHDLFEQTDESRKVCRCRKAALYAEVALVGSPVHRGV